MHEPSRSAPRGLLVLLVVVLLGGLGGLQGCGGDSAPTPADDGAAAQGGSGGATPTPDSTPVSTGNAWPPPALTEARRLAGITPADLGPGEPDVDRFHPDRDVPVEPALGGRIVVHMSDEPANLNYALKNMGAIRRVWFDVHAGLLQFDPTTWDYELDLATDMWIEDTLVLAGGRGEGNANVLFGDVEELSDGGYRVSSGSPLNATPPRTVAADEVDSLQAGTVFTFRVRDALWHDGHALDADDLLYSWRIYQNPHIDCDERRFRFEGIVHAEKLDDRTVRFFWKEQYYGTIGSFGLSFPILPRHRFDLLDPDNADHRPDATLVEQGTYVNENEANILWVGLGPYKVTEWVSGQYIKTERFDDYWSDDPRETGWFDEIRWRVIRDDNVAFEALINGELDVFYRVKSEDFFGELTDSDAFKAGFVKAFTYVGNLGYTTWNAYRPPFDDVRVRTALAHAFDVPRWIETNYKGYALWSTWTQFFFGPGYDHDLVPLEYDVEKAAELLAEAGWYDRDGNGLVDKDGEDFVFEMLMPTGNKASERFMQGLQSALEKVGVKVEARVMEWATLNEKVLDREFDAVNLAWTIPDTEGDPFQIWHGQQGAFESRSANHFGMQDEIVDDLIERGRRELDPQTRWGIWKQLHRRVYELQPYLFGWNVPRKLALNRELRGLKLYKFDPGFRVRDLYFPKP